MAALGAAGLGAGRLNGLNVHDLGVACRGEYLLRLQDIAADAAHDLGGAAVLGAGGLGRRLGFNRAVACRGDDYIIAVGLGDALIVEEKLAAGGTFVIGNVTVLGAGRLEAANAAECVVGAVAERSHGEGGLVGHIEYLFADVIDNADKLSAVVPHGGVLHGEGLAVAEGLAAYADDETENVNILEVHVVEILKLTGLQPHIFIGYAVELVKKAEIYFDFEYGVLGLGNGDVIRADNVELTSY